MFVDIPYLGDARENGSGMVLPDYRAFRDLLHRSA